MKSSCAKIVSQLRDTEALLQSQALQMERLRSIVDVQFTRLAHMQAELDVLHIASGKGGPRPTQLLVPHNGKLPPAHSIRRTAGRP